MLYPYRHQPLKSIYLLYQLFATLVRIPLWILLSVPKSWRPRESWSIQRVVHINIVRLVLHLTASAGPLITLPNHLAITPGAGVNGVWVEPVPELVKGKLEKWMITASVKPARIPGYWMHKKGFKIQAGAGPKPGEKVLYHLHGGAYIRLSAHPSDVTAAIPRGIMENTESILRSFSLEYRLSSSKPYEIAHPFPSALLDALAGYNYLTKVVGFAASNVIITGDSAGGNLALALTRYLIEYGMTSDSNIALPAPPDGIILLSPWCDLSASHEGPTKSSHQFVKSDYLSPESSSIKYSKDSFLGPFGLDAAVDNPYISPASLDPLMAIDFKGFPRTLIIAGGAEVLHDQIVTLKEKMIRDLGENVTYHEEKDACHDFLLFKWHEPERTNTFMTIANWI